MSNIIHLAYAGNQFDFRNDGWFNATLAAAKYGKRPVDWTRLEETQAYLAAIADAFGISEPASLIKARRNSGTWLHPKLAVRFAQWLDLRFAVWCDMQIDGILRGTHQYHDRQRLRHEAASTYKVMTSVLQMRRQAQGKTTARKHFMCEANLVNWALAGKFEGLDRDALSAEDLGLLAKLEEQNAVMIGCGMEYDDRKPALKQFAANWRMKALEAA